MPRQCGSQSSADPTGRHPHAPRVGSRGASGQATIGELSACGRRTGMWRSLVAHLTGGQGVAGSNPVIPTKALVRGNFHRGFVVSGRGHWLVHWLDRLEPSAAEVDQSGSASLRVKCTRRCPWSGPESAQDDAPAPSGRVGAGFWRRSHAGSVAAGGVPSGGGCGEELVGLSGGFGEVSAVGVEVALGGLD